MSGCEGMVTNVLSRFLMFVFFGHRGFQCGCACLADTHVLFYTSTDADRADDLPVCIDGNASVQNREFSSTGRGRMFDGQVKAGVLRGRSSKDERRNPEHSVNAGHRPMQALPPLKIAPATIPAHSPPTL